MINYSKILLIEDDDKKIKDIAEFINGRYDNKSLIIKKSYQSGLKELIQGNYDLLLLDMSIPTWEKSIEESGGDYEKFGGYKILREIIRKNIQVKTILITMFDDFGESDTSITLNQLNEILKEEFSNFFL